MKIAFALTAMALLASFQASAADVLAARLSKDKKAIEVDVRYGGGCKEHKFELQVGGCLESMPVQCGAKVVDLTTGDFCEAIIHETVSLPLQEAGLLDGYYSGASITILNGKDRVGTVVLPR